MDFLSIIIVAVIVIWFCAAIRYMVKNKGGCACGGCKKSSRKEKAGCMDSMKGCESRQSCTSCGGSCTGCIECGSLKDVQK